MNFVPLKMIMTMCCCILNIISSTKLLSKELLLRVYLLRNLWHSKMLDICVLASLLLKQNSCMMLDTMFQHLGTVQCALFMWLDLHTFKESTSYFLFAKLRVFCTESDGLLFPKVVVTI